MKKELNLILVILLFINGALNAQQVVRFTYDDAGNRTYRTTIVLESSPSPDEENDQEKNQEELLTDIEKRYEFESLDEGKIKVYPNPVKGELKVKLENFSDAKGITLQLYSTSGNLIESKDLNSNIGNFDMNNYSPGIYILCIVRQDEKLEFKIIKQ